MPPDRPGAEVGVTGHGPDLDPWRPALRRLASGLIAYGVIGLIVATTSLVGLSTVSGRVSGIGTEIDGRIASVRSTLDATATALDDAGTSAVSFAGTLERTPPSVRQAATTVTNLEANLRTVEGQLGSLSILGTQPLADVARLFGQMATDMDGLDTKLGVIADDLDHNRTALVTNSSSLRGLGTRLSTVSTDLRGVNVATSLSGLSVLFGFLAALLVVAIGLPAIGALILGSWLQREVRRAGRVPPEARRHDPPLEVPTDSQPG